MDENKLFKTPILFMIFNRLDTTKRVFAEIKKQRPKYLYLASDDGRDDEEKKIVQDVRDYVLSEIDWDCKVKTLFRDHNLGCKYAVSGAIDWFFSSVEMGIILEDDCLPNQSFFLFCETLLTYYKDEKKVWHIGGCNFQNEIKRGNGDYYFSHLNHIWGWATWADRWQEYEVEISRYDNKMVSKILQKVFESKEMQRSWFRSIASIKNSFDTWDFQWQFAAWRNEGVGILPQKNLVTNIGFDERATHTRDDSLVANRLQYELELNKHPEKIEVSFLADRYEYESYHHLSLLDKIQRKLHKMIYRKRKVFSERNI